MSLLVPLGAVAPKPPTSPEQRVRNRALLATNAKAALQRTHDVPSPCISVCRMEAETGWCEGCYRTLDELRIWRTSDDATKRTIWMHIAERLRRPVPPLSP